MRGAVLRLHRRMREVRHGVFRFDALGRTWQRAERIADPVPFAGIARGQTLAQERGDRRRTHLAMRALVPGDRQRIERLLRVPGRVANHRDRSAEIDDLLHALAALDRGFVETRDLAAEDRRLRDRAVDDSRRSRIDAEDRLPRDLPEQIEATDRLADQLPLARLLEFHVPRRLERGRHRRDLAEARRSARGRVSDDRVLGAAFTSRHAPFLRCRRDQHLARRGAGLAQIIL